MGLLRQLSLSVHQVLFCMLVALTDCQVRIARTLPQMHAGRCTHLLKLLATRQHYGHRFEQDDDSFWHHAQPGFWGAVSVLS
jgi:hypothetical protein